MKVSYRTPSLTLAHKRTLGSSSRFAYEKVDATGRAVKPAEQDAAALHLALGLKGLADLGVSNILGLALPTVRHSPSSTPRLFVRRGPGGALAGLAETKSTLRIPRARHLHCPLVVPVGSCLDKNRLAHTSQPAFVAGPDMISALPPPGR